MRLSSDQKVNTLLQELEITDPPKYALMEALRDVVFQANGNVGERVMYGGILFSIDDTMFCGIFSYKNHVSMEFGDGYLMKDMYQMLEGKGKFRRHLKILNEEDITGKHVVYYIDQALAVMK